MMRRVAAVLATLAIAACAEEFEIVVCKSTQGPLEIHVVREWSPRGAARFLELVDDGYFSDLALFRCVRNFLCQFGYKDLAFNKWSDKKFPDDDKSKAPSRFKRGYVCSLALVHMLRASKTKRGLTRRTMEDFVCRQRRRVALEPLVCTRAHTWRGRLRCTHIAHTDHLGRERDELGHGALGNSSGLRDRRVDEGHRVQVVHGIRRVRCARRRTHAPTTACRRGAKGPIRSRLKRRATRT